MSAGIRSGVNWTRFWVSPSTTPERLDQPGLGEPGHADQQHMTARQQRDKRFLDDAFLAEDRAPDLGCGPG